MNSEAPCGICGKNIDFLAADGRCFDFQELSECSFVEVDCPDPDCYGTISAFFGSASVFFAQYRGLPIRSEPRPPMAIIGVYYYRKRMCGYELTPPDPEADHEAFKIVIADDTPRPRPPTD